MIYPPPEFAFPLLQTYHHKVIMYLDRTQSTKTRVFNEFHDSILRVFWDLRDRTQKKKTLLIVRLQGFQQYISMLGHL